MQFVYIYNVRLFIFISLAIILGACASKQAEKANGEIDPALYIYSENLGWKHKVRTKVKYHDEVLFGKVKLRGGMSSKYFKHSYTMELKLDRSIGGLPADDDWILNANYIDKTFQRHKLSYDLFREMSSANRAPKSAYLPLYLNDNYEGLYVAMQKVNGSWLNFDKEAPGKACLFKDAFIFVEEVLDNVQEPDNYYQQKFPDLATVDYKSELDELRHFIFNASDQEFDTRVGDLFDLRNVIDWQLLLMLTNNHDGLYKNFYIYRLPHESKFSFIPWDYDHSFGRDGDYTLNLIENELGWEKMPLFKRLMSSETLNYPEKLKKQWLELRQSIFTEAHIFNLIDENTNMLKPFLTANTEKWPNESEWYLDANNYDQEIAILKKFVPMRLKQLDEFFNTLE